MKLAADLLPILLLSIACGCSQPEPAISWSDSRQVENDSLAVTVRCEHLELQPGDSFRVEASVRSLANSATPEVALSLPGMAIISSCSLPASLDGEWIQRDFRWTVQALGAQQNLTGLVRADVTELPLPPLTVTSVVSEAEALVLPPALADFAEFAR